MPPSCLTVLAAIRQGDVDALQAVLRPIGDDINGTRLPPGGRPHVAFTKSSTIHFARFAILTDPERGAGHWRLLFASVYDGTLDAHLAEIAALTTDLDAIWGHCDDYDGADRFTTFMKARALDHVACYIAFRDQTVASIRRAVAARRARDAAADAGALVPPAPAITMADRAFAFVAKIVRGAPIVVDVVDAVSRHGLRNVYRGTLKILASLDRNAVFELVNLVTGNRMPPRRSSFSHAPIDVCAAPAPLAPGDDIPSGLLPGFREDVVTQNQLTLVTVIEAGQVERLGAVMSAIDSYAKRLSPPGSLMGVSTIHFVRWCLLDNGRRVILISDYDGSWENYIDEFAEMILSGLDAIWETAPGYPPDGARDLPAFKHFLRSHQVPADVFFSAYPDETIQNIVRDIAAGGGAPAGAAT